MNSHIKVVKVTGEKEDFDQARLAASLVRSGASEEIAEQIASQIASELRPLTPSVLLYQKAFRLLAEKERRPAARYSLKKAIHALGPTGFPFEELVAEIFRNRGYDAKRGLFITGKCATHEVDVLAVKNGQAEIVEAKFHNQIGLKSDLKVALYVKARFEDLIGSVASLHGESTSAKIVTGYLITNTKFTETAVRYSECAGLNLVGWNYPEHKNLHDWIEEYNVHPITCLRTLPDQYKQELIRNGILFLRQLDESPKILTALGIGSILSNSILEEVRNIL